MRKSIVSALAALALTGSLAPAAAAEVVAPETSVEVRVGDLDLTSPAGAAALEGRIDSAVDRVCAKPDVREVKAMKAFEVCQAEARDAAMEQLSVANPFDGIELASNF